MASSRLGFRPPLPDAALRASVALALLVATACASSPAPRPGAANAPVTRYDMEPIHIEATRTATGVEVKAYDAAELFEMGKSASAQGRPDEAEKRYNELLSQFPDSSYVPATVFNLGIVYQDRGEWPRAAEQFQTFVERFPASPDVKDAIFLRGISLAEAGAWPDSERLFTGVLERDDLSADDRVEAMTRRGIARFNQNDLDGAEQMLRNVFAYKQRLDVTAEERLDTDYYLALAQYVMAQVSHRRSGAVALRWPEAQMNRDLEDKARLLLEARRRYIDAVRYGNARVASMAAYQIGTLFQEFYDAVMAVPAPGALAGDGQTEVREVYFTELRKKLRNVLEKSLRGHEHNIELFERLGVETEWVKKSRDAIDQLRRLLDSETELATPPPPDATPASDPPPPDDDLQRDDRRQRRPAPADDTGVKRQIL